MVFIIPPKSFAELEEDLALLRAACQGTRDATLSALLDAIASRPLQEEATFEDVERTWGAAMGDADRTIIAMKRSLAAHIRAGTEPVGARVELRALVVATETIRRRREMKRRP